MKIIYCDVEQVPLCWGPDDMTYSSVRHHYDAEHPELFHNGVHIKDVIAEEAYDPEYTQSEIQAILDGILE